MSCEAAFLEAQSQLTTWTDELEFLCYILCELIDAESLSAVGHEYHQAADFPTLSGIIRRHIRDPSRSLAHIMSEDELASFRRLLKEAKEVRNISAHHGILTMDKFNKLEGIKQRLSNVLENSIRKVASDLAIDQVCFNVENI
jgi:hypothetical protein